MAPNQDILPKMLNLNVPRIPAQRAQDRRDVPGKPYVLKPKRDALRLGCGREEQGKQYV
jgi:hypothetical protein